MRSDDPTRFGSSKVPPITFAFWIVKIMATTIAQGGDALSMTLNAGAARSMLSLIAFFLAALAAQVSFRRYRPLVYWLVVVSGTRVAATASEFIDRSFGLGYTKSTIVALTAVISTLIVWHLSTGSIAADRITTRRSERFYWAVILVSTALGTALGDFVATATGIGFQRAALVFMALLGVIAVTYFFTSTSNAMLFWAAYVFTQPLGAALGDTVRKALAGLGFGQLTSLLLVAAAMIAIIATTSLRGLGHSGGRVATHRPPYSA
jgi:uncharacterized membrane-anchored protein